jgi:D-amino-acid oxidase
VIGLTAALSLREAGVDARIVTAALPAETTSSVAAALWYPYKAYPEDLVLLWGKRTFEVFEDLARIPESGVYMRYGVELWHERVPDPWWVEAVPQVRRCAEDELPPGYRDGHAFVAPVVEMPVYLGYLLNRFARAGGRIEQRAIHSLENVGEARVVVNCAGLGARELAGDLSMEPIRGQIVRVRNPGLERFMLDEENPEGVTYVVPRSDDCILGGTAEEGAWDTEPDPETAADILSQASRGSRCSGTRSASDLAAQRYASNGRTRPAASRWSTTTGTAARASRSPGAAPKRRCGSYDGRSRNASRYVLDHRERLRHRGWRVSASSRSSAALASFLSGPSCLLTRLAMPARVRG